MKTVFIDVNAKVKIDLPKALLDDIPTKIGLFTTAQFLNQLDSIKAQLEKAGKQVTLFKTAHTKVPGQILGCNLDVFKGVDALLFIGDGEFHPKALAMKNSVFAYNPLSKKHTLINAENKKQNTAFLSAESVGVLITTKPGQQRLKDALALKDKYPDKNFYYLLANNLKDLENFPFIQVFVNSACPRIASDILPKPVLNIDDL